MSAKPELPKLWSNVRAYGLSVTCLLAGLVIGYLLRVPAPAKSPVALDAPTSRAAGMGQLTAEQLKHMADKKAEPLLAELQKHPKDADLLAKIASTYFAAHQFKTAQEYYERALAVKGKDAFVLSRLSSCYYYAGDADKAIATLEQALKIEPGNADALFNLGMLEWRVKTDPKAAIAAWEKLLQAHPDDPNRSQVEQLIARARQHLNIPPGTKTDKPAM